MFQNIYFCPVETRPNVIDFFLDKRDWKQYNFITYWSLLINKRFKDKFLSKRQKKIFIHFPTIQ